MTDRQAHVDTVVFDLDGTLVDSAFHHALAWRRAFLSVGHNVPCWRLQRHIGMGGDRLVAAVAGDQVEREVGDRVREAWEKEYDAMLDEPVLLPGARELLSALRERGLRVVLASSAIPRHADRVLRLLDADRRADASLTSEDAEKSKPDPELLEKAMERVDAGASLLIGDSVWDVEAGLRAGIPTVAVLSGGYAEEELRAAGATWVFEDPADLLNHLDQVVAPTLLTS
jgi:HAD superfamily hydrolase (TIGR01549 family)